MDALYDRVVPDGVVVLDEYAVGQWGESDAVDEFIIARQINLRSLPWTHSPSAYFVKRLQVKLALLSHRVSSPSTAVETHRE